MSLIAAIKSGNVVYLCCDTQSTGGKQKMNSTQVATCKISKLSSGMLVGVCGKVIAHQCICADESIFELDGDSLSKKDIVNSIIPKIKERLRNELIDVKDPDTLPFSLTLAYKDKLFRIEQDCMVICYNDFCASGSGCEYAYAGLDNKNFSVRERLLCCARTSAKHSDGVSAPFVLIDTNNLEYEFVEG